MMRMRHDGRWSQWAWGVVSMGNDGHGGITNVCMLGYNGYGKNKYVVYLFFGQ